MSATHNLDKYRNMSANSGKMYKNINESEDNYPLLSQWWDIWIDTNFQEVKPQILKYKKQMAKNYSSSDKCGNWNNTGGMGHTADALKVRCYFYK